MDVLKILIILILFVPSYANATALSWKQVSPGLEYTVIFPFPNDINKKIHAFRIDLNHYKFSLLLAKNQHQKAIFVTQAAMNADILIALNGGFFTPNFEPLGLRISAGKVFSPLKNINWWGIFIVEGKVAEILSRQSFRYSPRMDVALQAGPRLIINGTIPKLKDGLAQRSAVGITQNGKVILVVTQNLSLSTVTLATMMKNPETQGGLACYNALNLDGGSSSQLYAHIGSFHLDIPSIRPVAELLVVTH